jgi:hypothetical protein
MIAASVRRDWLWIQHEEGKARSHEGREEKKFMRFAPLALPSPH